MNVGAGDIDGFLDFLDVFGADFSGKRVDLLHSGVAVERDVEHGDTCLFERLQE